MSDKNKKLAKNSLLYSVFTLLQKGFAFFLIPIYTTKLSTEEYGILGVLLAAIPFFVLIAGASLRGSSGYFYYQYKDTDREYLRNLWGSSFVFILIFSVVFAVFLWIGKEVLTTYFFNNIPSFPYLFLALISVSTQPIYFYYQSILKAKQEARKASLLDFSYFISIVSITMLLILVLDFKADGALLALAISNVLLFIYSIYGLLKEVNLCLKKALLKRALKYSLPILPHNLSGWAMNMIDRLIINNLNSLSVVALFDVGSQIGKIVNIITLGVNSAYSPWFFDQVKNDENSKKNISDITGKILLLYAIIAVIVSWFSPELLKLISKPAYHESWKVVPLIATGFVINGFYFSFSNVFFLEKTKYLPFLTFFGAILNIGLNFYLIPKFGIFGAATAFLLTKILFVTMTYIVGQRLYSIPYRLNSLILIVIFGFLVASSPYFFQSYLDERSLPGSIFIKLIVLFLLGIPVYLKNRQDVNNLLRNFRK